MMIMETIGENAGIVWSTLNNQGAPLTIMELRQQTAIPEKDLYAAIGWLAREGKVFFGVRDGNSVVSLVPVNVYL